MLFGVNTWWAHQNDLWRLSRGVAVVQLKDSHHFFKRGELVFGTVKLSDATRELILDTLEVDLVLSQGVLSQHLVLSRAVLVPQFLLKFLEDQVVRAVEEEHLVRDHLHVLKSDGLQPGSREAFQNPAFPVFFSFLYLPLDQIYDDLVTDVRVGLPALLDLGTVVRFLQDLVVKQVTD